MKPAISRRDFLKLAGTLPIGMGLAPLLRGPGRLRQGADGRQNVLIIIFDALSAYHLSFHGYQRETTPNLTRLLDRAIIYHNHYAPADFTTPGTASLLTGTMPWTHRAFQYEAPMIEDMVRKSIFRAFEGFHRVAYSHNPAVNLLLNQFGRDLDRHVPQNSLFLTANPLTGTLFRNDESLADVAMSRILSQQHQGYSNSLFVARMYDAALERRLAAYGQRFPIGLPGLETGAHFVLEDAIDWLQAEVGRMPQPFLGYFHYLPPHDPSAPPAEFHRHFAGDGYRPFVKPLDIFADDFSDAAAFALMRRQYDEFILYADREFGRLFDYLESSGVLENTWLVFTSDHGELFERGVRGHQTAILYEALIRVPLVIFEPGRRTRTDVHSLTTAIDLLPTLLHLAAQPPADWAEGTILPPFSAPPPARTLYSLHARKNQPNRALEHATAVLINDSYKLLYFFGYEELGQGVERIELYDLKSDPEELHDLFSERRDVGTALLAALKDKLTEVNRPYL